MGTATQIDPDIRNYRTDEVVLGADREIGAEFAVGVANIWRRYGDSSMSAVMGLTSADYVARTSTPPAATCPQPSAGAGRSSTGTGGPSSLDGAHDEPTRL